MNIEEVIDHLEDLQVFNHEPTETDRIALGIAIDVCRSIFRKNPPQNTGSTFALSAEQNLLHITGVVAFIIATIAELRLIGEKKYDLQRSNRNNKNCHSRG